MNKEEIRKKINKFMNERDKPIEEPIKEKKPKIKTDKSKHAEYFEGQLQMRNINQEILNYVQKRITETGEQVPTVKMHSRYDLDYNVSSRKLIHQIGIELRNKFGGTLKESEQLFSFDHLRSKNVYRLNVYYKAHEHERQEIVIIEGIKEPFRITGFSKDKLIIENIITGKKNHIKEEQIIEQLNKYKTKIIELWPNAKILDEDYQMQEIIIPKGRTVTIDENIKYVKFDGKFWII